MSRYGADDLEERFDPYDGDNEAEDAEEEAYQECHASFSKQGKFLGCGAQGGGK